MQKTWRKNKSELAATFRRDWAVYAACGGGALISVQICTADASRLDCNLVHIVGGDCENVRQERGAFVGPRPSFISMPPCFDFRQF